MTLMKNGARVGAAAFALGLSLAGPQALGVASAETSDTDAASESRPGRQRTETTARSGDALTAPAASTGRTEAATPARSKAKAARSSAAAQRGVLPAPSPAATRRAAAERMSGPVVGGIRSAGPVSVEPSAVVGAATSSDSADHAGRMMLSATATATAPAAAQSAAAVAALPSPPPALTALNTAVTKFFDSTASWLAALPAGPVRDVLAGGLLLVRRTLFNQLPETDPFNYLIKADGTVAGNVFASDAENDALAYTLTKLPEFGTVQLGSDGGYTYTPGAGFNGYDSFTVAVQDRGFNLLSPFANRSTDAFVEVPYWSKGGSTNRWAVTNFSASPVTLTSLFAEPGYSDAWDAHPPLGTVLQPGDEMAFELTRYAFYQYGAGPNFTGANGNKWDVVFYTNYLAEPEFYRGTHCDAGDCRVLPDGFSRPYSTSDYRGVLLLDAPGTVTINAETPGATDMLNSLIDLVVDDTGGGVDVPWNQRWTATYNNITYTGNVIEHGDPAWTSLLNADNPTDSPQAASEKTVTTSFATTTTATQQCGVPNCDYGFNLATGKWLAQLVTKAVTKDPNPVANTYGMSKATTDTTTYSYTVTQGTIPWSANEVMLAPPTVDVVGDVTITYTDWCTTPSCADSKDPAGYPGGANQGAGGTRTYEFKDVAFKLPNFAKDGASFEMLTEPLQPKVGGVPTKDVGFKVKDPASKFLDPTYKVGDQAQLSTIAYNGYGDKFADFTQRATYTSSNPEVAAVDASGKLIALAPGTTTITARYDWSMPLGGGLGIRSDYVWADMDVTVEQKGLWPF